MYETSSKQNNEIRLKISCFGTNIQLQFFANIDSPGAFRRNVDWRLRQVQLKYWLSADRINLVRFFFSIYTIISLYLANYYLKSSTFLVNIWRFLTAKCKADGVFFSQCLNRIFIFKYRCLLTFKMIIAIFQGTLSSCRNALFYFRWKNANNPISDSEHWIRNNRNSV